MASSSNMHQISPVKTMQLNDQKAGMQGLDKEAINKVIYEASKGTPYFVFQEKRQQRIDKHVEHMLAELQAIDERQRSEAMKKVNALAERLETTRDLSHSIVHVDMDAFYAAVEMLDRPELKTKPMAVGTSSMLSTSNYEARRFGVRAAMPGFIAKKLCPSLVIVPHNFDKYKRISKEVRNIVKEYDPNYAAMSLDEMYFDLTDYILKQYRMKHHQENCNSQELFQSSLSDHDDGDNESSSSNDATTSRNDKTDYKKCKYCCSISIDTTERDKLACTIVEEVRKKICEVTQLTASAGIAPNTMLAKVCSDQNKPNGQYQIKSNADEVKKFISTLPVKKVSGIGPVQSQLLNGIEVHTCEDLWKKRDIVSLLFSSTSSEFYLEVAMGLGSTVIKNDYVRKSIGVEVTFKEMHKPAELHQKCEELCEEVVDDLKSRNLVGKVVVLKIKTVNFDSHTRNFTLPLYTSDKDIIMKASKRLLDNEINTFAPNPLKLRLMGIRIATLLKESEAVDEKQAKLKDFLKPQTSNNNNSNQIELLQTENVRDNSSIEDVCEKNEKPAKTSKVSRKYFTSITTEQDNNVNKLTCPVCDIEQNCIELSEFNLHVDDCLSKKAVKEILSAEMVLENNNNDRENEKKRKKSYSKTSKKFKHETTTNKKINEYFK